MIVKGTYTSVWDGGICLESNASIDTEDRTFEIDDTSYDVNVDVLEDEYVTLPVDKGWQHRQKEQPLEGVPGLPC